MERFLWGWVAGVLALLWRERLDSSWLFAALTVTAACMLATGLAPRTPHGLRARRWLPCLCGLALGLQVSTQVASRQMASWLPLSCEGKPLRVRGEVVGLPEPDETGSTRLRFQPDAGGACIAREGLWQLSLQQPGGGPPGKSRPGLSQGLPVDVRPGERWQFFLRLKRPHGLQNPGGFDGERWWHQERITATGWIKSAQRLQAAPPSLDGLRWRIRQRLLTRFPQHPQAAGTVLALLTGDRIGIDDAAWLRYSRTGITHLVAISGVHITMVAWLIGWLLQRLWLRLPGAAARIPAARIAGLGGLLAACGYGLLAGMGLPTQRTLVMLGVLVLMRWLPGEYAGRQILLLALAVVLAGDPLAVHSVGLWLSFAAVALLMAGGMAPGEEGGWRSALRAQWLATWGLTPLTLALFARISWISLPVNLVAIPWVTFAIVPLAMLGLLLWPCHEGASDLVWSLAIWLMAQLDSLLAWVAAWPGAVSEFALPGVSVLWLALVLALLLMPRALPGRLLAGIPLLAVLWPQPGLVPGQMRLTVLDVGQGLSVHVQTATHNLLFDTGPPMGAQADAGGRVVLPYLRWRGVRRLDVVIFSHDHIDHTGGGATVLQALPVAQVLGVWPSLLARWPAVPRPAWQHCLAGQSWTWDGVHFSMLWPFSAQMTNENERSCVLRIEAGGQVVLLPGDLESGGEQALLANDDPARLRADLLVLGHHGSNTSSTAAFLHVVRPQEVVAAVGHRNRYRHPSRAVVRRLAAMGIPGWRSDETGAVQYDFLQAGEFPSARRWRPDQGHYWLLPVPTAGQSGQEALSMLGALPVFP